jgi:serine/threonine-protein kinase
VLGEGSFGSVYLADMEGAGGFKRRVALKLLNDAWDPSSDAGQRMRDEARLLGRLDHPNIVRVDDLVRVNGRWALVMEYVSGADVEAVYALAEKTGEPIPPRAAVEICASAAAALVAAWETPGESGAALRVVHRDIKPSNVRLTDTGVVKVLDFGVARAEFAGREAHTERVRYGSLGYMAPERILGGSDAAAGDVYALAVMAYELLTLRTFGRAELALERQAIQVDTARDAVEAVVGDGPLAVLLARSLAYTPEDRPSVSELEAGLRALARDLPGEDLSAYARRILPQLAQGATRAPELTGTVLEESASGGGTFDAPNRVASATLVFDPLHLSETTSLPLDPPAPPPRAAVPYAVAGFIGVLLLGALGYVLLTREPAPSIVDARAPAAPSVAAPLPAPAAVSVPAVAPPTPATVPAPEIAAAPAPIDRVAATRTSRAPPVGASTPADKAPAAVAPDPAEVLASASSDPTRLRAAKFTVTGASGIRVACGDVVGTGEASTLLRNFPAGACRITVGADTTTVQLDTPRGVACVVEGGSLTCR